MPVSPSSSLATQRPDLESSLEEFDLEMNIRGMIGARIMPVLNVASQAGNFGKIPLKELLKKKKVDRAPGGGYNRSTMKFDPATYACLEKGSEEPIDDREAEMYANYFDLEMICTMRAWHDVLLAQEQRIADLVFNTSTWTGASLTTGVSTEWSTWASATPIQDVAAAIDAVFQTSGLKPNALICNDKVFRNLKNCDEIIERVKYQGYMDARAGNITTQAVAQALDLQQVIVAGGAENVANENQDADIEHVWDDEYAMVAKVATTNDPREPCIGRIYHWGQDGSTPRGTIETYRDETVRGDVVRVRHDVDEQILYKEAGHLLSNITA